jgi:membrane-bound lytic murein transglycosylase D
MRTGWIIGIAMFFCAIASGQEFELDTNAFRQAFSAAEKWAKENLDEDALSVFEQVDRDQVEQFLLKCQNGLKGEYVIDVASLKSGTQTILPLLDAHEESQPYAAWLRSRLDYFDVAEEFKRVAPPPRKVPGEPSKPPPNPTPDAERKAWETKLRQSQWPKGAGDLVPKLKPVFAEEKVPPELIWVAEVESGFNKRARSPVGAAGLFQLMPATAKRYGLGSFPTDDRYDPESSARAAAQYLRFLHGKFNDWPLALAAYNAGEGTVQRLMDKQKARSFDGIATRLPAETQMYVPKVEATIFRREGVKLSNLKAKQP